MFYSLVLVRLFGGKTARAVLSRFDKPETVRRDLVSRFGEGNFEGEDFAVLDHLPEFGDREMERLYELLDRDAAVDGSLGDVSSRVFGAAVLFGWALCEIKNEKKGEEDSGKPTPSPN
ncbi:MAG: hypothetical protein HZA94_02865 [Candidatus Vogelbacteria bacterium]|nr:hypothetical protein [Candidatus Vogelbacteria bacterium]